MLASHFPLLLRTPLDTTAPLLWTDPVIDLFMDLNPAILRGLDHHRQQQVCDQCRWESEGRDDGVIKYEQFYSHTYT